MDSLFQKHEELFTFYDLNGNKINRKTEIRYDPLTGESSRIVFDPGTTTTPPDYTVARNHGNDCPFCSENIFSKTPIFPKDLIQAGRLEQGEAVLFPNLYPYGKYSGVTIFSKDHDMELEKFSSSMLRDTFQVSQIFLKNVVVKESNRVYPSINWNYLPLSGGSILHPHLQMLVSESATNYQSLFIRKTRAFRENHAMEYLDFLYEKEKQTGERWIGEYGQIAWMTAFSPKGHHDYIAIFRDKKTIDDIQEQDWNDFCKGLTSIFKSLVEQGLRAFNLSLHILDETSIHARLIPRLSFGELGTSDFNYTQVLHDEGLTYKAPEEVAAIARKHFVGVE